MAFGINLGKWFKDRTDEVRDIFDANTAGDYARRAQQQQQQGQPVVRQTYAQQQIARGNTRPYNNIGQQVFGNVSRLANTVASLPAEAYGTTRALSAMATGNQQALTNANTWNLAKDEVAYNPTGGLLRSGTLFDSAQQKRTASNLDALKRGAATGIGTFGEVFPVGRGVRLATTAGKISKPAILKVARQGAMANAGADVGQQYISTGKVDPKQVVVSALTGAGLSVAPPAIKLGAQKLFQGATPVVKPIAQTTARVAQRATIPPKMLEQRNTLLMGRQNAVLARKPDIVANIDRQIDALDNQIDQVRQGGFVRNPLAKDTPSNPIQKALRDIEEAKQMMAKAPSQKDIPPEDVVFNGTQTKESLQQYIDDTQRWIDSKAAPQVGKDPLKALKSEVANFKSVDEMLPKGVPKHNIISTKIFGSSINGKNNPNDIDIFVKVKEGFEEPQIIDNGKLSYLVANEEYADQMLKDMVKDGAMEKDYLSQPIEVRLDDFFGQPKTAKPTPPQVGKTPALQDALEGRSTKPKTSVATLERPDIQNIISKTPTGKSIGKIGDLITNPQARVLLKDVLDVEVVVKNNLRATRGGKPLAGAVIKRGDKLVVGISKTSKTDPLETIAHEAQHLLRLNKGRELPSRPQFLKELRDGLDGYNAQPTEQTANRFMSHIKTLESSTPTSSTKVATIKRPVQTKTKLAEPPMPPAKVGVQTMSPPPPPKGTGVKMLPSGKTKKTRFASKTVPESEFVSEPVKGSIKAPDYSPQTEKQGYANALGRLKQQGDEAFENDVFTNLNKKPGTISRQEAIDSITAAQMLDSYGDEASIRKATDIYEKLSEHYTAAGQLNQTAAILARRSPEGMRGWATSTLKKAGVEPTPQLQSQIVDLAQQKKFTELAELVSKNIPSSTGDKIVNLWRAGLLTAPTTTFGNLLGNTGEAAVRKGFVNPVATIADTIMGKFTGKRTMSLAKPGEYAKGVGKGAKEFKQGVDNTKYDVQKRTNYNNKVADAYVNGVYKLMGIADKPYSTATMRESLSSMAKAEAINKGLKGADKDKFIKDFIDNPPEQARLRAEQEGDYSVFKNPTTLGKAATGLKRPLGPVGDFVVPFTQVPAAIATRIVERTPIGIANQIVKHLKHIKSGGEFDQRAMSQAIGNGAFGPAVIGAGFALANADMLTYGYPTDKKERALWDEEGKQPYSVKIGDRWYSMNYLQPFGALLAIGGQASEAAKKGENISEIVGQGVATAGQSIMNQSFLKGIGGALDAISDPERSARKYIEQTTSSLTPNFVRSFARASDDIQRAPEGVVEGVKSGIPGLREQTTPKYSAITGDPLPAKDNFANQYLNPLKPSKVRQSDLTAELRRLQDEGVGTVPSETNKNAFGEAQPLSKKQLSELNAQMAKSVSEQWNKIIADPRYKKLSKEQQQDVLKDVSTNYSAIAKAHYAADNGFINDNWEAKLTAKQKRIDMGESFDFLAGKEEKVAKIKSKKTKVAKGRKSGGRKNSISFKTISPIKKVTLSSTNRSSGPNVSIRKPKRRVARRTVRIKA